MALDMPVEGGKRKIVASIHWGFSLGGVAKYAVILERLRDIVPVDMHSICVLPENRKVDEESLSRLHTEIIRVRSVADLRWIPRVRRSLEALNPSAVISHGFNGHLVSLIGVRPLQGVRRLASYHGCYYAPTVFRKPLELVFNGFSDWYLRNRVDNVVCVCEFSRECLVEKGVDSGKISVVHNGIGDLEIDDGIRRQLREEWGISDDHIVIGVASRLDPVKGLTYLIDAFSCLAKQHPSARLVLVGDGTEREYLQSLARKKGIINETLFLGARSDVPNCMAAFDIFALPSLRENHSIGLLEAMRAALPAVATNVGGNGESVRNEREGLIVPSADAGALGNALSRLVSDPDLRKALGRNARKRFLEEFTEEAMLDKLAGWMMRALGAPR